MEQTQELKFKTQYGALRAFAQTYTKKPITEKPQWLIDFEKWFADVKQSNLTDKRGTVRITIRNS